MNGLVMWELGYVGKCLLLGAGLMFLYDILRIARIVIPHSIAVLSIEDIIYWMIAGVLMFLLLYKEDAGSIRWFAVAVTALGMIVYNFAVSRFTVPFIGKVLRWPLLKLAKAVKAVTSRLKASGKLVTELLKKRFKKDRIEKRMKKSVSEKVD
ncbi:MAG: spore cortex biosynthesis protein YabQ [Lachnospiraceae bacterium]|nr:spore cortex biosynthesis protein YabQ [Lachnospiraceae bacterium]